MNTKFKLIAASLAAPLAIGLAAPAVAAPYGNWDRDQREYRERGDQRDYRARGHQRDYRDVRGARQIERKLNQLRRDIRQARRSGELSRNQAYSVRSRLEAAERSYFAFARNGLSRHDIRTVNWRISQAYDVLDRARYNSARVDNRRDYRDDYRGGYRR
uniref:hypothetical protein n=1 Tax=Parerythrobacter lutipelagi TaxID=1964208 RepID=UPI0010F7D5E2|nr:hypothetical protein [Parerythrobacter lutipelagi]